MEHETTLFHAIEPIKKCFVLDTLFYDHIYIWSIKTLDGSAWRHNYHLYTTSLYLVMDLSILFFFPIPTRMLFKGSFGKL